jgi:hypothetical protein
MVGRSERRHHRAGDGDRGRGVIETVDNPMIWLRPMIKTWKTQYLRALLGYTVMPDGVKHIDGWPANSPMARVISQLPARTTYYPKTDQRVMEVFTGDGLRIRKAIEIMPYEPRLVFFANQLSLMPVRKQMRALKIVPGEYYRLLDKAHFWLAGRLSAD